MPCSLVHRHQYFGETCFRPPPPNLLSETFKGRTYAQLRYGMKPSLDKGQYPPFWAVKLYERLLQRFLRLVHGMQGVRKQIAFLLRAGVLTKVPASLYQLCKAHLALHNKKKSLFFFFYFCTICRHIVQSISNSFRGFRVDPLSRCSDYPTYAFLIHVACSPSCIGWSTNVPPP